MRARDESGKPLFRDDGKPLFHVRPGREADTVLCWREVEDGPATPVILLEHFDEMIELHEGALEHHTRNVAELESKHRRLEHIVVNHLPAHLGKVPRLDRQHTADTFADLFRELLGHLIEHASDAHDGNDMSSAQVAVTYEEAGVLNCLKKRTGRLTINVDIEQETGFSKSTVSNSVNSLIEKGLAHRPSGERKGATLTAEGQRFPTSAT
jgi:DNA-binding MarR family transcriptional regulator